MQMPYCLSFVLLQDGARSDLRCFLHELWHSRQQLPAVVAAAVGIGSAGAPPPRRVSSKTGFKQSGRAAAAEGRVISPGRCSKEEAETKRKRASESNIFQEKRMAAALSPVELQPHRSCAALH